MARFVTVSRLIFIFALITFEQTVKADEVKSPLTNVDSAKQLLSRGSHTFGMDNTDELSYMSQQLGEDDAKIVMGIKHSESKLLIKTGPHSPSQMLVNGLTIAKGFKNYTHLEELAESQGIRAMVYLSISHDLHKKQEVSSDDEIEWINHLAALFRGVSNKYIDAGGSSKSITVRLAFEYVKVLLNELREITDDNNDAHVLSEGGVLNNLGNICLELGKHEDGIHYSRVGISLLKSHFGDDVTDYAYYARLLNTLGLGHYYSGHYSEAEKAFSEAIDAYDECVDVKSKIDRYAEITVFVGNLKTAQSALGKDYLSKSEL